MCVCVCVIVCVHECVCAFERCVCCADVGRLVLSHVSSVMVWGPDDTGDDCVEQLPHARGGRYFGGCVSAGAAAQAEPGFTDRLLQGLAKQVFREYQRALWDPCLGTDCRRLCACVCVRLCVLVCVILWPPVCRRDRQRSAFVGAESAVAG